MAARHEHILTSAEEYVPEGVSHLIQEYEDRVGDVFAISLLGTLEAIPGLPGVSLDIDYPRDDMDYKVESARIRNRNFLTITYVETASDNLWNASAWQVQPRRQIFNQ